MSEEPQIDSLSIGDLLGRRPVTVPEEDATVLIDDEAMATAPLSVDSDGQATTAGHGGACGEDGGDHRASSASCKNSQHVTPIGARRKRQSRSKPLPSTSPRTDPSALIASASLKGEDLSSVHGGYASIVVTPYASSLGGEAQGGAVDEDDDDDDDVVVGAEGGGSSVERPMSAKSNTDVVEGGSVHATPLDKPLSPPDQHYSLCSMIEYGVSSEQGSRKTMEDRHTARLTESGKRASKQDHEAEDPHLDDDVEVEDTPEDTLAQGVPFFGVYDGHGGTQCAAYLRKKLDKLVLGHPKVIDDPETALKEAIEFAEQEFLDLFKEDSSGSTAAVAIIVGNKIITANVGDTEIVLNRGGEAICLSEKHNVKSSQSERDRVVAAGGRLYQNARVAHPLYNPQVLSLGVSRAIGDSGFKLHEYTQGRPSGVVATPTTQTTEFNSATDEFLLIGCDGVWDVMSYQQAVDYCVDVQKNGIPSVPSSPQVPLTPQQISSALVTKALELGSNDNVTAMFISLRTRPRSANHRPPSAVHERWGNRARSARKLNSASARPPAQGDPAEEGNAGEEPVGTTPHEHAPADNSDSTIHKESGEQIGDHEEKGEEVGTTEGEEGTEPNTSHQPLHENKEPETNES